MDQAHKSKIKLLYWNCNNIINKIHELYDFMLRNFINVACLCETFLSSTDLLSAHPNFTIYRNDRININNRHSGGVAILVRKTIHHKLLDIIPTTILENIGIEMKLANGSKIQLFSVYLPGSTTITEANRYFKQDLRKLTARSCSYFAVGDYNAKHRSSNCVRANTPGNILYNQQQNSNFFVHHPSDPTHFSYNGQSLPSTIDLCITNSIHQTSDFESHSSNSDHVMVTFDILLNEHCLRNQTKLIPAFNQANWTKYQQIIYSSLTTSPIPQLQDINDIETIDHMIHKFTDCMLIAKNEAVPLLPPKCYALNITPEIKNKIRFRNILKRQAQRNPYLSATLRTQINSLNKEIQSEIKLLMNENFNHKLSTIPHDQSVWKTVKFLKTRHQQLPTLRHNNQILITAEEKSNALSQQFVTNHENLLEDNNKSHTKLVNQTVKNYLDDTQSNTVPEYINICLLYTSDAADE